MTLHRAWTPRTRQRKHRRLLRPPPRPAPYVNPNANSRANFCTNTEAYTCRNSYAHPDSNFHADAHSDFYVNPNAQAHPNFHADAHSDFYVNPNAQAHPNFHALSPTPVPTPTPTLTPIPEPTPTSTPMPTPTFFLGRTYQGVILQLTIDQIVILEEVAYIEEPEVTKELVFQRDGTGGGKVESLAGSLWTLESLGEWYSPDSVISGVDLTLELINEGELRGNAGCNSYFSNNYSSAGGIFVAGAVGSTRRTCGEHAGIMEQEARFLELLSAASSTQFPATS